MTLQFFHLSKNVLVTLILHSILSTASCQNGIINNNKIFTCCHLQETLDAKGVCGQPTTEFDVVFFNDSWRVPPYFKLNEDASSEFLLSPRKCQCKEISKFTKVIPTDTLERSSSQEIHVASTGILKVYGGEYIPGKYCFNRLEGLHPRQRAVAIDIRFCSNLCKRDIDDQNHFSDEPREVNSSETKTCSVDSEKTDCNRTFLLVKNDHFSLVGLSYKSNPVEDHTYPWKSLNGSAVCKSEDGVYRGYCIADLKNTYYYYQKVYAVLAGVSGIFLLLNLSIYFALRDSLSISGWTEFMYSLSLYLYCVFSIPGLLIVPDNADVGTSCYVLSIFIQFFELANGATLVALSWDILLTFWKYDKQGYTDDPRVTKLRLSLYIILSLVVPSGIITYGILKNQRVMHEDMESFGTPQYGLLHCTSPDWFVSSYTRFGMQTLNLLLVLISAYVILNKRVIRHNFGVVQEVLIELNPDRMDIFSKLFVFVFAFWTIDFMEVFFSKEIFTDEWHGIAFHIINYIQGMSAFFILVFNRQTLRACGEKNWNLKHMFQHACTCGSENNFDDTEIQETEEPQISPFMKTGTIQSYKRSTVRGDKFY